MKTTKIYEIASPEAVYLVRASSARKAIAFIVEQTITARVPSQDRLIELGQEGHTVLDATADPDADVVDAHFAEVHEEQCVNVQQNTTGEIF